MSDLLLDSFPGSFIPDNPHGEVGAARLTTSQTLYTEVYMQMDKRNQIGCEDTTKLSANGVRFDPKATYEQEQPLSVTSEASWRQADPVLASLGAPVRVAEGS